MLKNIYPLASLILNISLRFCRFILNMEDARNVLYFSSYQILFFAALAPLLAFSPSSSHQILQFSMTHLRVIVDIVMGRLRINELVAL